MSEGLPERLARAALAHAPAGTACEECVVVAIRSALDEAARAVRRMALSRPENGDLLDAAVAIEALKG